MPRVFEGTAEEVVPDILDMIQEASNAVRGDPRHGKILKISGQQKEKLIEVTKEFLNVLERVDLVVQGGNRKMRRSNRKTRRANRK